MHFLWMLLMNLDAGVSVHQQCARYGRAMCSDAATYYTHPLISRGVKRVPCIDIETTLYKRTKAGCARSCRPRQSPITRKEQSQIFCPRVHPPRSISVKPKGGNLRHYHQHAFHVARAWAAILRPTKSCTRAKLVTQASKDAISTLSR